MVVEVAALIAAFSALLLAGAALVAAFAYASERRVACAMAEWQLVVAMRAETEYQKAHGDFVRATEELEKRTWQKEPSN